MTDAVHLWGDEVAGLSLADEMDDIELGERVSWDLLMERLAGLYTFEEDRERSMTLVVIGRLASAHDPAVDAMLAAYVDSLR